MRPGISLRSRIFLLIAVLTIINISGSLTTIYYTYRTQKLYTSMINRDVNALMSTQKLENALVLQKGLTTYFFLTNASKWLNQLDEYNQKFLFWLKNAREYTDTDKARSILNDIEFRYIRYIFERDKVIEMYKKGKKEAGAKQHWQVRKQFVSIYDLCDEFKLIQENSIIKTRANYKKSAKIVTTIAWCTIPTVVILVCLLFFILYRQILEPIRKLALKSDMKKSSGSVSNEINALAKQVDFLVKKINDTHAKLEESRESLMHSEKLAQTGKLAAGMAHSVRNPLTSVKMRLFSLERSLNLNHTQMDDLDVISEEIRYIDTILRNFLEFARPPKMQFHMISPSEIVDTTLELLKHRIESYKTDVKLKRNEALPAVSADAEQLKEVMVNILLNACEAMGENGTILIEEKIVSFNSLENFSKKAVQISIHDNGPGISKSMQEKIFQPFFSSKEEGSGLGLSIAKRIIDKHKGKIIIESEENKGTTFIIQLPF